MSPPPGPVLFAYDGSPAAENAIREAGPLLGGKPGLVLVIWKQGLAFELLELPRATLGLPPARVDIRTAIEIDLDLQERARRLAQKGAGIARAVGFDVEALVVADDPDVQVGETIVDVARKRETRAIVIGAHGHGQQAEILLGGTTRGVVRHAPCPVLVVRERER
jgi:nucleotide-binding universal stress UspA family protein